MPVDYPKRERFFAHRFCRLMGKVCIGGEIGPETCWLLAFIAHTEDAAGYRRSVTFFNEDLATRTGLSITAMSRARDRAVKAGWLVHNKGAKRRPASYFVTIPDWAKGVADGAGDERPGEWEDEIPGQIDRVSGEKAEGKRKFSGEKAEVSRGESGEEAVENRETSARPSSQYPLPQENLPLPQDSEPAPTADEFAESWNSLGKPFSRILGMSGKRLTHFQNRRKEKFWCENWKQALDALPQRPFLRGESGRGGWIADADWFLKPDSVRSIIEGKYLDGPGRAQSKPFRDKQTQYAADTLADIFGDQHEPPTAEQQRKFTELDQ